MATVDVLATVMRHASLQSAAQCTFPPAVCFARRLAAVGLRRLKR